MKEPAQDTCVSLNPSSWLFSEWMTRHTNPYANADNHGYFWGAVAERFEWVHCDVTAVPAHGSQSDARGLHCHLANKIKRNVFI